MINMKKLAGIFLALIAAPMAHAADQSGLYAPPPPANAAYVRVIEAPAAQQGAVKVGAASIPLAAQGASAYYLVNEGSYKVWGQTVAVKAGRSYSLTPEATIEDPVADNPAKALLVFYNLTPQPSLTLATEDGKTAIVKDVAHGAQGSRAVNALTIGFAAQAGDKTLATVPAITLEKGQVYSLIATEKAGQVRLTLTPNSIAAP